MPQQCDYEITKGTGETTNDFISISYSRSIAVTTSGVVHRKLYDPTMHIIFTLHKVDPIPDSDDPANLTKLVDTLGDEALFLDSGITVPADHTLGIEPNSIYFTRVRRTQSCNKDFQTIHRSLQVKH